MSVLSLVLLGCTHLPPRAALEPDAEASGRALVEACVETHGGLEAFRALGDVSMRVEDRWQRLFGISIALEQPGDPLVVYNVALQKGAAGFAEVDERWGHDSVQAWVSRGGVAVPPERPAFFPSYGYFFSLPFKFLDPGVRYQALGRRSVDGVAVDEVLVGFEEEPGRALDVYVLRIDAETHELRSMLFTFRDMGRLPELEAVFHWQELGGARVPERLDITLVHPLRKPMHQLTFADPVILDGFDRGAYEKPR